MGNYIIITEDGMLYLAKEITKEDISACLDGLLSIIRTSDYKQLSLENVWVDLQILEE